MKRLKKKMCLLIALGGLFFLLACGAQNENDPSTSSGQADDDNDDDALDDDAADDDGNPDDDAGDDDTAGESATIILPDYPFWPNDALAVDLKHLEELATAYCADQGDAATSAGFFLGALPLKAVDLFCEESNAPVPAETLLGDLYLSGYFGGLWLRDLLNFNAAATLDQDFDPLRAMFNVIVRHAGDQLDLIRQGDEAAIISAAGRDVYFLLFIFGYNRGYLEQIIDHPPAGVAPPDDKLVCNEGLVLDCNCPGIELALLQRWRPALDNLRDPPTDRWSQAADLLPLAEKAVANGRLVWNMIDISGLSGNDYLLLVDLSAGFLMISEAAVLGDMTAWAETEAVEGRCSLSADNGLITWAASYFMGLMSSAPAGTFPELICP